MSAPDPYRCPDATGPTPKRELAAVRVRSAWRSFWRHRADEVHAVAVFVGGHFGTSMLVSMVFVFVGVFSVGMCVADGDVAACADLCDDMGAVGSTGSRRECHCIDTDGKPWAWKTWPGSAPPKGGE